VTPAARLAISHKFSASCGCEANKLAVVPTERVADEALARVIVSTIDRDSRINVEDVDVTASNGKVTLSGAVPSRVARLAAYHAALYTSGITDIEDHIIVV
jgi:osmotically-inducible protein OsmY